MSSTNLQTAHLIVDYSGAPAMGPCSSTRVVRAVLDSSRRFRLGGSVPSLSCALLFAGLCFQLCGGYSHVAAQQSNAVAASLALGEILALCIVVWARTLTGLLRNLDVIGEFVTASMDGLTISDMYDSILDDDVRRMYIR